METIIKLETKSKDDLTLLVKVAKKIGITVKILTKEDAEDAGLLRAMNTGRTNEYVDNKKFLSYLKK